MNTSLRAPITSICGGTSTPTPVVSASVPSSALARQQPDANAYNNCVTSRRSSQCYSELSNSRRQSVASIGAGGASGRGGGGGGGADPKNHWASYRTDVTGTSLRTPISSGKFRTNFPFRQALVPEGYPKLEHKRNPRRDSFVAEFSRKLAEGYDIWEDEDRPVINWVFPRMPIRKNKTHELRMMANRERITKMLECEKQMNKRNTRMMGGAANKKETAWWERCRNGMSGSSVGQAGGHAVPRTPRTSQVNRGWSSNVSVRPSFASKGSIYGARC